MAYGAWYDELVKAGKQTAASTQQSLQKTGQQLVSSAQTAAKQAVSQTAQTAQKAVTQATTQAQKTVTGQIQTGTQAALQKIGVQTPKPTVAPTPAPAPTISVPKMIAEPLKAVAETVKKAPVPTAVILAAAGFGIWWFFIRKK